jgi:hypothetical protein
MPKRNKDDMDARELEDTVATGPGEKSFREQAA